MITTDFKPGDRVRVKPQNSHAGIAGDWICDKMLTKNWELKRPADYTGPGAHKRLRAKPYQLEKVDGITAAQAAAGQGNVVMTQVNDFKIVDEGAIILVNDPSGKIDHGLYVVTKSNITGNPAFVNITEVGGGKKWRCPVQFVRVIPKGEFTIHVK